VHLLALAYCDESSYNGQLGDTSGEEMVQQVQNVEEKRNGLMTRIASTFARCARARFSQLRTVPPNIDVFLQRLCLWGKSRS